MKIEHDWQAAYRDMIYWQWNGILPVEAVRSDVGFMAEVLVLKEGDAVLDVGCGLGQHAIELARRGCRVVGVEQSEAFLAEAGRRAGDAGVSVELMRGDMRHLSLDQQFDAVVLWGNSFPFFSDEDNAATLRGVRGALKPGGHALIDTQNYKSLPEKLERRWAFAHDDANLLFLSEGSRDVRKARFGFTVTAINLATNERHTLPFSWRLYLVPELERVVADAGLSLLGIYGDDPKVADWRNWRRGQPQPYSREAFTDNAAKRILLCQR